MKTFDEIIQELKNLKKLGFVKTHRSGPTGIGKTLEALLAIKENNIPGPDIGQTLEIKSARKNTNSMITLFTKSPLPLKSNTYLLKKYGYITNESKGRKILHTTINGVAFNKLRGNLGFKARYRSGKIILATTLPDSIEVYWTGEILKQSIKRKYPQGLVYVKADSRGAGKNEEFHFDEAYLLQGFDFDNFIHLLRKGKILIDIRIGQYPDGRTHDHGTGFRVFPKDLDLCFNRRKSLF